MAEKELLGIEKLCQDNFDWKMIMELLFEKKSIDEVMSGVEVKPEGGNEREKPNGRRRTVKHDIVSWQH